MGDIESQLHFKIVLFLLFYWFIFCLSLVWFFSSSYELVLHSQGPASCARPAWQCLMIRLAPCHPRSPEVPETNELGSSYDNFFIWFNGFICLSMIRISDDWGSLQLLLDALVGIPLSNFTGCQNAMEHSLHSKQFKTFSPRFPLNASKLLMRTDQYRIMNKTSIKRAPHDKTIQRMCPYK